MLHYITSFHKFFLFNGVCVAWDRNLFANASLGTFGPKCQGVSSIGARNFLLTRDMSASTGREIPRLPWTPMSRYPIYCSQWLGPILARESCFSPHTFQYFSVICAEIIHMAYSNWVVRLIRACFFPLSRSLSLSHTHTHTHTHTHRGGNAYIYTYIYRTASMA
jgi:hypothetical protein